MRIKVLERRKNLLKIELEGESHTFCNALQEALLQDEDVELASYHTPHPLAANSIVTVRTKKGSPEEALARAAELLKARAAELKASWEKALE